MIVEKRGCRKTSISNTSNKDNVSTKSSTQQSQSSILNALERITNSIYKTQFCNFDNDNADESFEHRKPTIHETLYHIHISLEQVKKNENYPNGANI